MTPTPRTDEAETSYDYRVIPRERHYSVDADFARELECEIHTLKDALFDCTHLIAGVIEDSETPPAQANDVYQKARNALKLP